MANGDLVGSKAEDTRRTQQTKGKRPYTKPAFRFEQVFETQALSCGKVLNLGQCHSNRKTS